MAEDGRASERGHCLGALFLIPLVAAKVLAKVTCEACLVLINRWMDTTPSTLLPRFGIVHGSGAPYDLIPSAITSRNRDRYESWRRIVRSAIATVRADCASGRHHEGASGER